jgi:hypothetical protein
MTASLSSPRVAKANPQAPGSGWQKSRTRQLETAVRTSSDAPPIVRSVLDSPGQSLDGTTRAHFESRFHYDFSDVRVHADTRAAESAQAVNARAYTVGRKVVFARNRYSPTTSDGKALLAHELAHVVQQQSAPVPQGTLRVESPSHAMESEARAASMSSSVDSARLTRISSPVIARDTPGEVGSAAQKVSPATRSIIDLLAKPDPIAGVGDAGAAMRAFAALSDEDKLNTTAELATSGGSELDVLRSAVSSAPVPDRPRITAIIDVGRLFSPSASATTAADAAVTLQGLPAAERDALLNSLSRKVGSTVPVPQLLEGAEALRESAEIDAREGPVEVEDEGNDPTVFPSDVGIGAAAVKPGPWNPPGKQPIPFYIGTQAHMGIAATYAAAHPGHIAFYNFTSLQVILDAATRMGAKVNPALLKAKELGLMPDIINLSAKPRHLYEIKPANAEALAVTEANMYAGLLTAAGLPVTLGPTTEPGTAGTIPAPGGVYTFSAPQPGAITYRYRQPRRVRHRAREPARARARMPKSNPKLNQQQSIVYVVLIGLMMLAAIIWETVAG